MSKNKKIVAQSAVTSKKAVVFNPVQEAAVTSCREFLKNFFISQESSKSTNFHQITCSARASGKQVIFSGAFRTFAKIVFVIFTYFCVCFWLLKKWVWDWLSPVFFYHMKKSSSDRWNTFGVTNCHETKIWCSLISNPESVNNMRLIRVCSCHCLRVCVKLAPWQQLVNTWHRRQIAPVFSESGRGQSVNNTARSHNLESSLNVKWIRGSIGCMQLSCYTVISLLSNWSLKIA